MVDTSFVLTFYIVPMINYQRLMSTKHWMVIVVINLFVVGIVAVELIPTAL